MRDRTRDGAGNWQSEFVEQFTRRAAFTYAGGSEAVMAARLEGRGVMRVRVRSCQQTRTIKPDWRMRDVRTGDHYAIREVDAATDRLWVYIVAERGAVE